MNKPWIAAETDDSAGSAWKRTAGRLYAFVRGPGGWKVIVWAGLIGMAFIFLSNFWSPSGTDTVKPAEEWNAAAYTAALEERLAAMLVQIEGVGDCRVMITLENARQYVYTDRHEVVTEIQPTVKGVMVVCAGAEDEAVAERVQTAVQTVLHITARRVCVTPSI